MAPTNIISQPKDQLLGLQPAITVLENFEQLEISKGNLEGQSQVLRDSRQPPCSLLRTTKVSAGQPCWASLQNSITQYQFIFTVWCQNPYAIILMGSTILDIENYAKQGT